jgi:hypothetical protein
VAPAPTIVASDDELRGPDLPIDVLPDREQWHPRTRDWWRTWRRSAQAQTFTATDWDFLIDTALMHHTMWSRGRWEFAGELRLRAAKFGATPEDRQRLRMQVAPSAGASAEQQKPASRYGHLRAVKEA